MWRASCRIKQERTKAGLMAAFVSGMTPRFRFLMLTSTARCCSAMSCRRSAIALDSASSNACCSGLSPAAACSRTKAWSQHSGT